MKVGASAKCPILPSRAHSRHRCRKGYLGTASKSEFFVGAQSISEHYQIYAARHLFRITGCSFFNSPIALSLDPPCMYIALFSQHKNGLIGLIRRTSFPPKSSTCAVASACMQNVELLVAHIPGDRNRQARHRCTVRQHCAAYPRSRMCSRSRK